MSQIYLIEAVNVYKPKRKILKMFSPPCAVAPNFKASLNSVQGIYKQVVGKNNSQSN